MKLSLVFAAVLAVATAQFGRPTVYPQFQVSSTPRPFGAIPVNRAVNNDQTASIVRYDNESGPDGSYKYTVETDNGISVQAEGVPRDFGGNPPVVPVVSQGSFSWVAPDGQTNTITYKADENGFQPSGDAIPTPPPIPEAILRALQYIANNPPQKI